MPSEKPRVACFDLGLVGSDLGLDLICVQVQDVEGKLPPKVSLVIKVPMTPHQSAVYNWVKVSSFFFVRDQGRGGAHSHVAQRQPTRPSATGGD